MACLRTRSLRVCLGSVTLVAAFTLLAGGVPGSVAKAGATTTPYFTLSVTPTQNLTTGETMTVTVTRTTAGTAAGLEIDQLGTGWCTAGFQPPANTEALQPGTYGGLPQITGPHSHCTTNATPLNANLRSAEQISPPFNSSGNYPSATTTVEAETSYATVLHTGTTLACDAANPCTFVVAVFVRASGVTTTTIFLSVPVTYLPSSVNAACGGAAPGQLTTVAPDRLGQQIVDWTLDACQSGDGGGKALTEGLSTGQSDATALADFASGISELSYSAVGYGAGATFSPPTNRPYVAVPIAINAVVLAHVEAEPIANAAGSTHVFGDYPQLDITNAQFADLLGGGPGTAFLDWGGPIGQALLVENPSLAGGVYDSSISLPITWNSVNSAKLTNGLVATSLADATTLFATTYLHTLVPNDMNAIRGGELGVTADFGTAQPPYNVLPATGLELFAKDLSPGLAQGFALTNAATAAATWGGMADFAIQTPDSIGSASPAYVAPTQSSMDAAVSEMIPQPDGTLMPNPDATAVNSVNAYPLTFVEYAIAPTQPLLNGTCAPKTNSQTDLVDWLNYITGPGQAELVKGLVPLTPALQAQARAAIAKIGKTAPTGPCAPVTAPGTITTPSAHAASPAAATSAAASTGSATIGSGVAGTTTAYGLGVATPAYRTGGVSKASVVTPGKAVKTRRSAGGAPLASDLTDFKHLPGPGWFLPALGILLLVFLLPALALVVSGRTPRQALAAMMGRSAGPPGGPGEGGTS